MDVYIYIYIYIYIFNNYMLHHIPVAAAQKSAAGYEVVTRFPDQQVAGFLVKWLVDTWD